MLTANDGGSCYKGIQMNQVGFLPTWICGCDLACVKHKQTSQDTHCSDLIEVISHTWQVCSILVHSALWEDRLQCFGAVSEGQYSPDKTSRLRSSLSSVFEIAGFCHRPPTYVGRFNAIRRATVSDIFLWAMRV